MAHLFQAPAPISCLEWRYFLLLGCCSGEGNGTPLQYSCLENPVDGGAWWAAVHGVSRSRTRLHFHFHFSLSRIGEGNGNPLQCSCLENPRDRGAWWAAVYGVAQSRTRLKRLSSSINFHPCSPSARSSAFSKTQLEHLEVHSSHTVEVWLGEF